MNQSYLDKTVMSTLMERGDDRLVASGMDEIFSNRRRWQAWLDVEAALAFSEGELGMIPKEASDAIMASCYVEKMDFARLEVDFARTKHPFMPVVLELSRVVGDAHGGWVHWGATTQNIMQTGDTLIIRDAHKCILHQIAKLLDHLADLSEKSADMVMPGRTHGQHAVPITMGLKFATWIYELTRHVARLNELGPRLFCAIVGGAAGTFASFGSKGEAVQRGVAAYLKLEPMRVPSRSIIDQSAEFVCVLGMLSATCGKMAHEVFNLMKTEYGEVEEFISKGTVGSSTMPQKRNPLLSMDVLGLAMEIRSIVPMALEAMYCEHESDHASNVAYETMRRAAILSGDMLCRMEGILNGLVLKPDRMKRNSRLSNGLICAESIMLELGLLIGRQEAHELIYECSQRAAMEEIPLLDLLSQDARITPHLNRQAIEKLVEPSSHIGLSAKMAKSEATEARVCALHIRRQYSDSFDREKLFVSDSLSLTDI